MTWRMRISPRRPVTWRGSLRKEPGSRTASATTAVLLSTNLTLNEAVRALLRRRDRFETWCWNILGFFLRQTSLVFALPLSVFSGLPQHCHFRSSKFGISNWIWRKTSSLSTSQDWKRKPTGFNFLSGAKKNRKMYYFHISLCPKTALCAARNCLSCHFFHPGSMHFPTAWKRVVASCDPTWPTSETCLVRIAFSFLFCCDKQKKTHVIYPLSVLYRLSSLHLFLLNFRLNIWFFFLFFFVFKSNTPIFGRTARRRGLVESCVIVTIVVARGPHPPITPLLNFVKLETPTPPTALPADELVLWRRPLRWLALLHIFQLGRKCFSDRTQPQRLLPFLAFPFLFCDAIFECIKSS